jgi:hypothetical protein
MSTIPYDCIKVICEYLTISELQIARQICKSWRLALVEDPIFFSSILKEHFLSDAGIQLLTIRSELAFKLLCWLRKVYETRSGFINIQNDVLYASSSDRWEESALNMIRRGNIIARRCYDVYDLRPDMRLQQLQWHCRCCIDCPCYWSSAPSTDEFSQEVLILQCPQFCLVDSISVRPYQAAWHRDSPTYGPKEVIVEFLSPSSNPLQYPPLPSQNQKQNQFRANTKVLFAESTYYRSPVFPIQNSRNAQLLRLPTPQLLIGGRIRIIFCGKQQRQTIGGDDYYLCMNPCIVYGVPLCTRIESTTSENGVKIIDFILHNSPSSSIPIFNAPAVLM